MNIKIVNIKQNIEMLYRFENFIKNNYNNLIFLCVGNSDVWYDSFGPIVGTLLKDKYNIPCFVYGNIYNNIKLSNLNNYIKWIKKIHFNKKIIVIDAALTNENNNILHIRKGETKCAYFNKDSLSIGDYSVLCPVKNEFDSKNFNFKNIINNSLIIVEIIYKTILKCKNNI